MLHLFEQCGEKSRKCSAENRITMDNIRICFSVLCLLDVLFGVVHMRSEGDRLPVPGMYVQTFFIFNFYLQRT